jgi:hypothetical protein
VIDSPAFQLPDSWAERLREEMAAEVIDRQTAEATQRELLTGRLSRAGSERRKFLDAYYGGAIDVPTLRTGRARIGADITAASDRLPDLDANFGDAYAKVSDRTCKLFNAAVFERLDVKDGRLSDEEYRPPLTTSSTCPSSKTEHEWRRSDSNR